LESSVLGRIPLELLIQITEYLPVLSAAAFSISCMQIKRLIGDQYLRNLAGRPADKLAFLDILALDLPDQVVCPSCQRLHTMGNAARYTSIIRQTEPVPACLLEDRRTMVELLIGHNFSTTIFRMAMKHYQQHPECSQFLKLLSYDENTDLRYGFMDQYKVDCRIIQGFMIHRVQRIFLSARRSSYPHFRICDHIYHDRDVFSISSEVMRCYYCGTEYRIVLKHYPGYEIAVFFTRWKNLGTGPHDEDWKRSFQGWDRPPKTVQFQAGDLSSVFEDSEDLKFDSLLLSKNKD
jgi:hypothetical protein